MIAPAEAQSPQTAEEIAKNVQALKARLRSGATKKQKADSPTPSEWVILQSPLVDCCSLALLSKHRLAPEEGRLQGDAQVGQLIGLCL